MSFDNRTGQTGHIGPGNDIDMIQNYGGPAENEQSSTVHGGSLAVPTVPTNEINKQPETESNSDHD